MKGDLAQEISDKLLKLMIENGSDWRRPWLGSGLAKNIVTKRSYRGVNIPILGLASYSSHWWGTYRQISEIGGQVRKGEKSTNIFFWKPWNVRDKDTEEDKQILIARAYSVFNAEQCDHLETPHNEERSPPERHADFDRIIEATGADITYNGDRAAYIPSQDRIIMPKPEQFTSTEGYAGTLAHEICHWVGHPSRLNRNLSGKFGGRAYGLEELIGEISSGLTCISAGVIPEPRVESAKYLNNWVDAIREDKRIVISMFSQAQAATDFILKFSEPTPEPSRPDFSADPNPPTKEI